MSTVTFPCGCAINRAMFAVDGVGDRPIMSIQAECSKHLKMLQTNGYEIVADDLFESMRQKVGSVSG